MEYKLDRYGFWKQNEPQKFNYDDEYERKQSTNIEMVYLRLGWLAAHLGCFEMKNMTAVDIGAGNGNFVRYGKNKFKNLYSYDITGNTISQETLENTIWDLVVLTDTLEHFDDINKLFNLNWKYAFISFPETPKVLVWEELMDWKHFKPDEHIWCLNMNGMIQWLSDNGCEIMAKGNPEDLIRTNKDKDKENTNISTILTKRRI